MNYKEAIMQALTARDMTQKTLSEKTGMTPAHINDCIKRRKTIGVDIFFKLMNTMGYEIVIRDKISGNDLCVIEEDK